jgi:hypothetical protein
VLPAATSTLQAAGCRLLLRRWRGIPASLRSRSRHSHQHPSRMPLSASWLRKGLLLLLLLLVGALPPCCLPLPPCSWVPCAEGARAAFWCDPVIVRRARSPVAHSLPSARARAGSQMTYAAEDAEEVREAPHLVHPARVGE